jgi:hypothetical protein
MSTSPLSGPTLNEPFNVLKREAPQLINSNYKFSLNFRLETPEKPR